MIVLTIRINRDCRTAFDPTWTSFRRASASEAHSWKLLGGFTSSSPEYASTTGAHSSRSDDEHEQTALDDACTDSGTAD